VWRLVGGGRRVRTWTLVLRRCVVLFEYVLDYRVSAILGNALECLTMELSLVKTSR
jgi:hypothetical protein